MHVVFIRAPRYIWPFINESDNWLMPLGYASLAAYLREFGIDVEIIDCPPLKMGWKSLREKMASLNPDIVGVGDETVYSHEGLKALKLAKKLYPDVVTVAGGHHFSNIVEESLKTGAIDFIVKWEAEKSLHQLIQTLEKGESNYEDINGLAFINKNGAFIETPPMPLIEDLDTLPMPAYDLLPMEEYTKSSIFYLNSASIYHSRGCIGNCSFCSCWINMAEHQLKDGEIKRFPRYRTMSPEKVIEHVDILHNKYGIQGLVWVDDTFNADQKWNEKFSDLIIDRGLDGLHWWAFLRADFIVRDEKAGIFDKMYRAGLEHALIGVERPTSQGREKFKKFNYSQHMTKLAFRILTENYPNIFIQATFLTGIRNETKQSMLNLFEYAKELKVDYPSFHAVTPNPGTDLWYEAKEKGWIEVDDFRQYDWFTPIMPSKYMDREEIAQTQREITTKFAGRPVWWLKGAFNSNKHRRKLYWWAASQGFKVILNNILEKFGLKKFDPNIAEMSGFMHLKRPSWYNS